MPKPQLHISGLNTLSGCGIKYENRYLLNKRKPTAVQMIIGTGTHKGAATDLEHKRETGQSARLSDIKDITRDTVVAELDSQEVAESTDDAENGFTKAQAVDKAVSLAELAHHEAIPGLFMGKDPSVMHVERQWVLDVDGLPFQLVGTIDFQQGIEYFGDWKTSGKSPVKTAAENSAQLTTYSMAIKVIDGAIPQSMSLNYLVQTPARKDLKFIELKTERTEEDFKPVLARIQLAHEQITSGTFHPAPMDSWQCSDRWCEYFRECPYSNKRTLITIGQGA